jgi:hypothetical protein
MNKLYSWAAQLLLSKILGGKKTLILGWLLTAFGAWNIVVNAEVIQSLCTSVHICLAGNATWGAITMVIGEITKVLRFATGQSYGDEKFLKIDKTE